MCKNTKIVATISDRRCDTEFLRSLVEAGADVLRLNTAHQELEGTRKVITNLRAFTDRVPVILDTKGPEVRTTPAPEGVAVRAGDEVLFSGAPGVASEAGHIRVSYHDLARDVPVGARILVDDGALAFSVEERCGETLRCRSLETGKVAGRKSVNVPGVSLALPALTDKDRAFIALAAELDITFIAHSFVRSADDVLAVREEIHLAGGRSAIIAKIEDQLGVDAIDEILDVADGIMVARGDLGIEVPAARIPGIQKALIRRCIRRRKPVIVATQMLQSMMTSPRATRAEISDVANAIYDGADAVMLSGETAHGDYPVEAVETMAAVAKEAEAVKEPILDLCRDTINGETPMFLARTAVKASLELPVKAIVTDTATGRTARYIAAFRGRAPVFTHCYDHHVMRRLALSYGIRPDFYEMKLLTQEFRHEAVAQLLATGLVDRNDLIVVMAGNFGPDMGASFVELASPARILAEAQLGADDDE